MRIAIISFFYKPAGGGVPRYIENISKKIAQMGHKVDIITASYNGQKTEKQEDITIYQLPCMNISGKTEKENKENSKKLLKFLREYIRKKPDVILAQNLHASVKSIGHCLATNMASISKNIPMILTVHAFVQENENSALKISMIKNLYWKKVICVSSRLAESLFNKGIDSESIKVISPPVDTEKFTSGLSKKWLRSRVKVGENETLILHASRLDSQKVAEEKGVFTLLKAFASLEDKNTKLLIASAPTIPSLEQQKQETIKKILDTAKLLNIEKKLIIETFDPEEMHHVYSGADLFVMASEMESFGSVYAEALACGIPVIGTTVGGIPEVINDGKSGELVQPGNHVELAKAIKKMLKNKHQMKKMGEIGKQEIQEKFNLDKICKTLIGTCESVIKKSA